MRRLFWICFLTISVASRLAAQDLPQWIRDASNVTVPTYGPKTSAVVLLAENRVSVESDGRIITTTHRVIRLLTREGRPRSVARAMYRTDGGKVRSINAWLLRPSTPPKKYD